MLTSQPNDFLESLIEVRTHGRYLSRLIDDSSGTLIGFHGYAENAERSFAELIRIPGIERWSVIAVQALHSFYVPKTGEVVASWMTKLNRDEAIGDNLEYVRRVVAAVSPRRPLVFLGFSQGAAMAYRAAATIESDAVIVLGGDLPPDVNAANLPPALVGRGKRDEWFTADKLEKDLMFLSGAASVFFDGALEWTDVFRAAAGEFLAKVQPRS
ncbi:MAG: putative esterase [Acidobacteria bacterium]|nr:putative esterase [Acidobacteriota bacterium]